MVVLDGVATRTAAKKTGGKSAGLSYGVYEVTGLGPDVGAAGSFGEMGEVCCLIEDRETGRFFDPLRIDRFLTIAPVLDIPMEEVFADAGRAIREQPYLPRAHPPGLKIQYEPFGASTDAEPLRESLERYRNTGGAGVSGSKKKRKAGRDDPDSVADGATPRKKVKVAGAEKVVASPVAKKTVMKTSANGITSGKKRSKGTPIKEPGSPEN
ncbi:hypothetical protein HK101_009119 [Irineochytrium annulatum]|nr:hypothetical protein HK101_009119 [Irineochytrium annulatum]